MTDLCLLADEHATLPEDLLAYETARRALSTYEFRKPYENALVVETISLGTAVSLLNDLDWYLARTTRDALVCEPSVDETEWLSRDLARAIRDGREGADRTDENAPVRVYRARDGRLVDPVVTTRGETPPDAALVVRLAST